jgi:hypothetical protein
MKQHSVLGNDQKHTGSRGNSPRATIEVLLETGLSTQSLSRSYKEDNLSKNRQLEGRHHSERIWAWKQSIAIVRSRYQATTGELIVYSSEL